MGRGGAGPGPRHAKARGTRDVGLPIFLTYPIYLSIYLSIYLFIYLSICLSEPESRKEGSV